MRNAKIVKPARKGFVLVPCPGAAHENPHIDNCATCAPRWGWVEVHIETMNYASACADLARVSMPEASDVAARELTALADRLFSLASGFLGPNSGNR
jgi:hypothetical protein